MRLFALILLLTPVEAAADGWVADAFGLFDPAEVSAERRTWSGYRRGAEPVAPGPTENILLFVGPKSIVAGEDQGHAVSILLDRNGNLAADGSAVEIRIDEDGASVEALGGIADHLFLPAPIARTLSVGASTDMAQSPRATARVVPDMASVVPVLEPAGESMRYEAYFEVATRELVDRYGNPVDDGTRTGFLLRHEDGAFSLMAAASQDGTATARFLARDMVGDTDATAIVASAVSKSEPIESAPLVAVGAPRGVALLVPEIGSVRVEIGPFRTRAGYALPDGADVSVRLTDTDGTVHEATGWVQDGFFTALFAVADLAAVADVTVETVLGRFDVALDAPDTERAGVAE